MDIEMEEIDALIDKHGRRRQALIPLLQEIQSRYSWLPEEALRRVAGGLSIPERDVYGVATFYRSFSLTPRGRHLLVVCVGTACHVRGGQRIADATERELGIGPGGTTEDLLFSFETVNCLGCCAIGPIVVVDGEYFGEMTPQKTVARIRRMVRLAEPAVEPA